MINASWVEFPKSLDDRRAFDSLVAGIRGIKPTLSPEEVKRWEGRRPYRGLAWMPMQKKKPNKISHTHKDE